MIIIKLAYRIIMIIIILAYRIIIIFVYCIYYLKICKVHSYSIGYSDSLSAEKPQGDKKVFKQMVDKGESTPSPNE